MKQEFPKCMYHQDGTSVVVENEDQKADLGPGWEETPAAFEGAEGAAPENTGAAEDAGDDKPKSTKKKGKKE